MFLLALATPLHKIELCIEYISSKMLDFIK